jgi:hypothetical protein
MNFSEWLAKFLGYGFSFTVAIMFLRNFFPFPIAYAPFVIGSGFVLIVLVRIISGNKIEIPKPAKSDIMPFLPSLIIALVCLLYFQAFPIFPQFVSADFSQHADLLRAILSGQTFALDAQVLKFAYLYLLAVPMAFSQTTLASPIPLVQIRIEMAIMVVLSPYFVYLASQKLFNSHRVAWITSLFYALSGFVWFGLVFNSGLYSNFYGVMASLFLISTAKDFLKD